MILGLNYRPYGFNSNSSSEVFFQELICIRAPIIVHIVFNLFSVVSDHFFAAFRDLRSVKIVQKHLTQGLCQDSCSFVAILKRSKLNRVFDG